MAIIDFFYQSKENNLETGLVSLYKCNTKSVNMKKARFISCIRSKQVGSPLVVGFIKITTQKRDISWYRT